MLKNMIFDMGGVLIPFNPPMFFRKFGITDEKEIELLDRIIVHSDEWHLTDQGYMTEEEMADRLLPLIPEHLQPAAKMMIFGWGPAEPTPGMEEFIQECKDLGLSVYVLSNASYRIDEYWDTLPGHSLFDGRVVSAWVHLLKPNPEIYEHLLLKYSLKPEECLFTDDSMKNVIGAENVGIHAIQFTGDIEAVRRERDRLMNGRERTKNGKQRCGKIA